ncbi:MAG: DUF3168 domain-containing protein [Notoacmeibacter sp.]|nr:DUF3168 domain-containing protein [Notoacmeibacter sp.]
MIAADMIGAVVALLKADADVSGLVGTRVFGIELPEEEAASMPRKGVVIRPSGGIGLAGGYGEITGERIDAISWGETPYEAGRISRAVFAALKRARRQIVDVDGENVLIHSAEEAGGRLALRDAETNWPAVTQAFQVIYALKTAA